MSGLTHLEKQKLERELGMSGGYVLQFTNRTFEEFFREVVGVAIYDAQFSSGSGSKANRVRAFWQKASDAQIRAMLAGLLEGWTIYANGPISESTGLLLRQIIARLGGGRNAASQPQETLPSLDPALAQKLTARLLEVSRAAPQQRGYDFERFLRELFDAYGLLARASFRLVGEQIDGSFVMHNETYLLEAKWQNEPTGAGDLHVFEGKLRQKADWSRGLFVSNSGFTTDGLEAFGRGKRVVCMDGFDLSEMFRLRRDFSDVMAAKVRRAAETGSPFVSVRDLFPQ
ncbi:MAG: restriction endonuclease [Verrucomicrobiota bacterium]